MAQKRGELQASAPPRPVTMSDVAANNKTLILALLAVVLSMLLSALDQTVVNPAMPRIVADLQGFNLLAWVSTGYLLTSTAAIPIAGKLGDLFGRKLLLITAVVIFLAGSALCGAASNMTLLVLFRAFQGIGAGALQANAFVMIAELFPDPARRAKWQGMIAAVFGLASVIGPALGGFITDNLVWRWVFYVNLPLGLFAVPALIFFLPKTTSGVKRSIDWWGAASIVGAISCLLLALTWGGQKEPNGYPWLSPQILGLFGGTIVLAALFVFIESRAAEPIVPLRLFKNRTVSSVTVISFAIGALMLGALYYIPLYVQVVMNESASSSGAITTPLALAMVVTNIFTGQFIGRVGILKIPMVIGSIVILVGVGLLTQLTVNSELWQVTLYMIVIGIGIGFVMPTMTIAVQESVQRRDLGSGISSVQFFRSIGSTVGVALIGTVVTNSYVSNINATAGIKALPAQLVQVLQEPQNLLVAKVAASIPAQFREAIKVALTDAVHLSFVISVGIAVVLLLTIFTVPNIRIKVASKKQSSQAGSEAVTGNIADSAVPSNGMVAAKENEGPEANSVPLIH
ncbi:MAG TPA: MDR family MFS transporter [Chloroflexia bacterium]|nr:MDR family MFS transporter [Chloroflexia bacterium]